MKFSKAIQSMNRLADSSEDNIINKSVLIQVLEETRKLLFPGYFDKNRVREEYIGYIVGDRIEFIQYNLKSRSQGFKGLRKVQRPFI